MPQNIISGNLLYKGFANGRQLVLSRGGYFLFTPKTKKKPCDKASQTVWIKDENCILTARHKYHALVEGKICSSHIWLNNSGMEP